MRAIVHRSLGNPSEVLELVDFERPALGSPTDISVRVSKAPIHHGDLLAISGSPAFGGVVAIPEAGRQVGFEGVGAIEALGSSVDKSKGLRVGSRVAFFPVTGAWSEFVVAPESSFYPVPGQMPDQVAALALINTITALLVLRAARGSMAGSGWPKTSVIQTGAGSAVGRLITILLQEIAISPVRLVRSRRSAELLRKKLPGPLVISTDNVSWKDEVREAFHEPSPLLLIDGVGGMLLPEVVGFLASGGTVVNYGSLGGHTTDIRLFAPRSLILKGVSMGTWSREPLEQRSQDAATAFRLATTHPGQFEYANEYAASEFVAAISEVENDGRSGTVLLSF
jgi:NADPH:quinone reductase